MTLLTGLREAALHVVRVCGSLKIFQMARYASRGGQIEVVVDVTIDALAWWNLVSARQLKSRARMIERCSRP